MNSQLDKLIAQLAAERQNLADHKLAMQGALDQFTSSDDVYTYNKEQADLKKTAVAELELEIKKLAKEDYGLNKDKHPHAKVTIKIFSDLVIDSVETVVKWARKNFMAGLRIKADRMDDVRLLVAKSMPDALELDFGKIEKYANDNEVPGTTWKDRPEAQIASKL